MREKISLCSEKNKVLIIDIDGVLAVERKFTSYENLVPIDEAKESIAILKKQGFKIILHTSRYSAEKKETTSWLEANGIEYDEIRFDKPRGIIYVDDRGYRFKGWKSFFEDVELMESTVES